MELNRLIVDPRRSGSYFDPATGNELGMITVPAKVDWDYYFQVLDEAQGEEFVDLRSDMNQVLIDAKVLCLKKLGCFGLIIQAYNQSDFAALNGYYYFTYESDAVGYLAAAIKCRRAKAGRDFVFQVTSLT